MRFGILALTFPLLLGAGELDVNLVDRALIEQRLRSGLVKQSERQAAIGHLFEQSGCHVEEQPVDKHHANVICTLPGESTERIIVGGHYDFIDRGKGIVDDWTGASLLPSLYLALKSRPRKHTYLFVAFTEEEIGLVGSQRFVKLLSKEDRQNVKAFVNLECLGMAEPKVWASRSTPFLVQRLLQVGRAAQIVPDAVNVERVGNDDTASFLPAKIPVITIHSVTQETLSILHSPRDEPRAVNMDYYYDAYKLVAFYLALLDSSL